MKFKLTWQERVCDDADETLYIDNKSQIIEAENEDLACKQWRVENRYNEYHLDLDDCVIMVDHPMLSKHLMVDMPNGITYGVPIEVIARHRSKYYAELENTTDHHVLLNDTIPLFEDDFEILDWATNNMNWSDVKKDAIQFKSKSVDFDFEDVWVNGDHKVV